MVVAAQRVANVVQQRHHHILLVAPVAMRARCGLQRVFEPIDRKAAEIPVEQAEMVEHAIGQALGESAIFAADDRPVFCGTLLHLAEPGALGPGFVNSLLHAHRVSPSLRLSGSA